MYLIAAEVRVVLTLICILLSAFVSKNYKLLYLTILPFITDFFDSIILNFYKFDLKTYEYQSKDKIIDWMTYFVIIILLKPFYPKYVYYILWIFLAWRFIGLYKFILSGETGTLKIFFDAVNSTMVVYYLSTLIPLVHNNICLFIIIGLLVKVLFEYKIHSFVEYK